MRSITGISSWVTALPWFLRIVGVIYAATPALFFWAMASDAPNHALVPIAVALLPAPAIAFGLFRLRRWTLTALAAHAVFIILIALVDAYFDSAHLLPMLAVVLAAALGLRACFALPDVRAPFLAAEKRGFRAHPRHEIGMFAELTFEHKVAMGRTHDLSLGGVYVECATVDFALGQKCTARFQLRDKEFRCPAKIVRINAQAPGSPEGLGLQFSNLKKSDLEAIGLFIAASRKRTHVPVILAVELRAGSAVVRSEAINITLAGCFVRGGKGDFHSGDQVSIVLELNPNDSLECVGEVSWLSDDAHQPGLGLQFVNLSRPDKRRLQERLARAARL